MRTRIGLVAVLLTVPALAHAGDTGFYIGTDLVRVRDKGDQAPAIYPLGLGFKVGYACNKYVSLEARYAAGIASDDATISGFKIDLDLDYYYGAYAKGSLPLGRFAPYVLVGYTHGKETATVRAFGISSSAANGSASFGGGADFQITKNLSANAEWARLVKGNDASGIGFTIQEMSVGLAWRF